MLFVLFHVIRPKPRIDDTVTTIVTDMLQWPHRIVVPIGGIPFDTSALELKPVGKLTITVVSANDLKNIELIGKSDPYVVVFDQDIGQDKRMGIAKLCLIELEPEKTKEIDLRLLPSLDMLKIKDKKDRGTVTIQVSYHEFDKEEQMAALEEEKRILEERKKLKEAGVIGSTMDALDGAASLVGSGVGLVGSGLGAGSGFVGSELGAVGSVG